MTELDRQANHPSPSPKVWSLSSRFLVANLLVSLAAMLVIGAVVGRQIEQGVLSRTAAITSLYVDSLVTPYLQGLTTETSLADADVAQLDRLLVNSLPGEGIVAVKIWSPEGRVVYSPNRDLIGRTFPVDSGLAQALAGEVTADVSSLDEPENEYEREHWARLVQVYAPVRQDTSGRIIASTEFYQLPDALDGDIRAAQLRSWAVVAATFLAAYGLLGGMVRQGSKTIARQQAAMSAQVQELSELLEQNAALQKRVHAAAERTTTLNEQSLRRTSADLHDGPGQALALALLRLDDVKARQGASSPEDQHEFDVVHGAVRDAMTEMRAIAAGLRLPELGPLSLAQVAVRAVDDHQRRSGTQVQLEIGEVPEHASLAVKIALLRTLQEALSNATRHAGGLGMSAHLWAEAGTLWLTVADHGPGLQPGPRTHNGGLGLANMRERAELLGGSFDIESVPGNGALLRVSWPLTEGTAEPAD